MTKKVLTSEGNGYRIVMVAKKGTIFSPNRYLLHMTKEVYSLKLKDIASIRSGLVLSRKRGDPNTGVYYPSLTMRAIQADGRIDMEELDEFYACERLPGEYITHAGDIVVRLTMPYTAILINEKTEGIVVSSNFVTIKVNRDKILPEYLYWLLNTKKVKMSIYENSTSNMLGAVKSRYFSEFKVYPVSLPAQEKIATVNLLAKQESFLLRELAREKEKYYDAMIDKLQKEVRCND